MVHQHEDDPERKYLLTIVFPCSVNESRKYAWKNRTHFCEFGAMAVFLEMTPVLNLLFFWTNVVGKCTFTICC